MILELSDLITKSSLLVFTIYRPLLTLDLVLLMGFVHNSWVSIISGHHGTGRGCSGRFASFQCQISLMPSFHTATCLVLFKFKHQNSQHLGDPHLNQDTPSAMLANMPSQGGVLIPDSGASFHFTGEPQYIHQLGIFERLDKVCRFMDLGSSSFNSDICFRLLTFPLLPKIY